MPPLWALEYPALGPWVLDGECDGDEDQRIQRSLPARTEPLAPWHRKHEQPSPWSQRKSNKDESSLWSMPSHCKKQFSSVAQSCLTLCDPMNHSTPGLPVHHQLPESTQTHVHRVSDAIQPSHPLSSPSPPAPNPSQHQGEAKSDTSPPQKGCHFIVKKME